MNSLHTIFKELTWDDLRQWAGSKILNRGKSYTKNVYDLARTEEGGLVAWVSGSEEYATWVGVDEEGGLDWFCTCPYDWGGVCKHGVAVVLAGLEQIKRGENFSVAEPEGDLMLSLFADGCELDDEMDWEEPSEFTVKAETALKAILQKKKKAELLAMLLQLAADQPLVRRKILEDEQLQRGDTVQLVQSLIAEIEELAGEPSWYNSWKDEGHLPDYSHVHEQLGALLREGHADAVLEVGDVLWERGNEHVEESSDEGDLAESIAECMEIVFQAVPLSSLSRTEQLLLIIDILLEDQYGLSNTGEDLLEDPGYTKEDWGVVADELAERLAGMPVPGKADFSSTYLRERLLRRLVHAYEQSGQQEQVLPFLEKEAHVCQCYQWLVDTLLAAGEMERARQWCVKGFARTEKDRPGIASGLQNRLREIADREQRNDLVAAYRAQDFFEYPSRSSYLDLQKTAEQIDCWPAVRVQVLAFLESGKRPDRVGRAKENPDWPLPVPEVAITRDKRFRQSGPDLDTLIEIAILEKRLEDVVALYRRQKATNRWGSGMAAEVAQAVVKSYPEVSLGIWKDMAESQIMLVKPKAYNVAAGYLRRMHKVYRETRQLGRWQALLDEIRIKHKAKRRLMEVLDGLENKRIVD